MSSPALSEDTVTSGTRRSARMTASEGFKSDRGSTPSVRDSDQDVSSNKKRPSARTDDEVNDAAPGSSRRSGRIAAKPKASLAEAMDYNSQPITSEERAEWKGWAEIESDPVSPYPVIYVWLLYA